VKSIIEKQINQETLPNNNIPSNPTKYFKAPYIRGASERVNKLLKPLSIKIVSSSTNTIQKQLKSFKDVREKDNTVGAVYQLDCQNCDKVYIGESGREI